MSFADQNGMMSTDQVFHLSKEQACEYFVLILQILREKIIIREPALSIKYEQSKVFSSSIKCDLFSGQTCIKCDPFKNVSLNIIVKFWDPRKKRKPLNSTASYTLNLGKMYFALIIVTDYNFGYFWILS